MTIAKAFAAISSPTPPTRQRSIGKKKARPTSLYVGISNRPLGWKSKSLRSLQSGRSKELGIKKWDGEKRCTTDWDGLRRDSDLWYPDGDCNVYLYGRGQSRRGPSFRVTMAALWQANCRPLLERFMVHDEVAEYKVERASSDGTPDSPQAPRAFELYIPAPANIPKQEAFLYHLATRNLFAWVFGKSLVGSQLGTALVSLMNSLNEFRSEGQNNILAMQDYMDDEGYADMRDDPEYAIAVLYFAEHFQFRDLWIDAFAHCVGMYERLYAFPTFETLSRKSRALISRSRLEMDMRLDQCGRSLSGFLTDELSDSNLKLSPPARAHLEKFQSFLQSHYVAKLGYYPPASVASQSATFSKDTYKQMLEDFQILYEYLVDAQTTSLDTDDGDSVQNGICVLQAIRSFDSRLKYATLDRPMPLLMETEIEVTVRPSLKKRLSWVAKPDKMKPDPRLLTLSSLMKATNILEKSSNECSLLHAYRAFEKDSIIPPPGKSEKGEKVSPIEGRKIRWILIYAVVQMLLSATVTPEQVTDWEGVSYNLCVQTAGCPPWDEKRPQTLIRTQTDQAKADYQESLEERSLERTRDSIVSEQLDVNQLALVNRRQSMVYTTESSPPKNIQRIEKPRSMSTPAFVTELQHPRPYRATPSDILVNELGGDIKSTLVETEIDDELDEDFGKASPTYTLDVSSRWSHSETGADSDSLPGSDSSHSRTNSDVSADMSKQSINEFLDKPLDGHLLNRVPSSIYSVNSAEENEMYPDPLSTTKDAELPDQTEEKPAQKLRRKSGIKWTEELRSEIDANGPWLA